MSPRARRGAAALVGIIAVACVAVAAGAVALRPQPIRTRADAVAYVLRQRGVPYAAVDLTDMLAGVVGYNRFPNEIRPYAVRVALRDGAELEGLLQCSVRDDRCKLSLAAVGIVDAAVPARTAARSWPWERQVARLIDRVGLRGLIGN